MILFCAARHVTVTYEACPPLVSENSADLSVSWYFKCLHWFRMYTPSPFQTRRARFKHAVCAAPCLIRIGHVRVYTVYIRNNLVRVYSYTCNCISILIACYDCMLMTMLWLLVKRSRGVYINIVYFIHTYYMGLFCAARSRDARDPWRMGHWYPLVSQNYTDLDVSGRFKCLRARLRHAVFFSNTLCARRRV